jgi:hypothetical protein
MNESRDESGQFTSPEPTTGIAAVEESQGYKSMPAPAEPEIAEQSIEEAVANQQAGRAAAEPSQDIIEVGYQKDGERVDPNETVSLDRASTDLGKYHGEMNATAERHLSAEFRAEVLKQRADLIEAAPELSEQLGLDAAETLAKAEAAKAAEQPTETNDAARLAEPATQSDAFDTIEGLEPELKEVLRKSPQAREFLEKNAAETETFSKAYSAALQNGQQLMRGTVAALAPQLNQIPFENWAAAITQIAQTDPVRGKLIVDTLQNWNAIQQQDQLQRTYHESVSQHEAAAQRQALETWRAEQNALVDKAIPLTRVAKAEFADDLVNYVAGFGVTRADLSRALEHNPLLSSAAFQHMAYQAVQYDKMMKAPKPRATPASVPVTRPGTASHRTSGNDSTVSSLQRQLAAAPSQQQQLKIAAKLLAAKRAG